MAQINAFVQDVKITFPKIPKHQTKNLVTNFLIHSGGIDLSNHKKSLSVHTCNATHSSCVMMVHSGAKHWIR